MELTLWILYYAVPATVATFLRIVDTNMYRRAIVLHVFVGLSALLVYFHGIRLEWNFHIIHLVSIILSILISVRLTGMLGIFYFISCMIQEACLLIASLLLISSGNILLGAALTSLVYTLAHINIEDFSAFPKRLLLIFPWGIISILLYWWFEQPLMNIAIHTILGAYLISKKVIYQRGQI